MDKKSTSWGNVSSWYDDLLKDPDTYQKKVILPNLLRILDIKKGERILDLGCGQGFFSEEFAKLGGNVFGIDISPELIKIAKARNTKNVAYDVSAGDTNLSFKDGFFDKSVIVLALQNIKDVNKVFEEMKRVLNEKGSLAIVLNHPSFRVPQASDWMFDEGKKMQGRVVYEYLSEKKVEIIMNPGFAAKKEKAVKTYSFHRSLQLYFKLLSKNGFAVTRLEEWISHKESGTGPRKTAEDKARKEIPLFMMIETKKI